MQVYVNGQDHVFSDDKVNVMDIIDTYNIKMPEMLAVQINGREVSSGMFNDTFLSDGDEVDYIFRMENCFYSLD